MFDHDEGARDACGAEGAGDAEAESGNERHRFPL